MKKSVMIVLLIILISIVPTAYYLYIKNADINLQYQDKFPSGLKMYSSKNIETNISKFQNEYKVVFYLSGSNPESLQKLPSINRIMKVHSYKNISYLTLWEDEIKKEDVNKAGIDENLNYSLKNKRVISKSNPNCFILDNDNKVILVTGYSYIDLADRLLQIAGNPDKRLEANKMILDGISLEAGKPTLLMFVSAGCRQCTETNNIIKGNIGMLQSIFNVVSVRPDYDIKQEYDKNLVIDYSNVFFGTYKSIDKIITYPKFVILNKNSVEIDKVFTDVSKLLSYIKGL